MVMAVDRDRVLAHFEWNEMNFTFDYTKSIINDHQATRDAGPWREDALGVLRRRKNFTAFGY